MFRSVGPVHHVSHTELLVRIKTVSSGRKVTYERISVGMSDEEASLERFLKPTAPAPAAVRAPRGMFCSRACAVRPSE